MMTAPSGANGRALRRLFAIQLLSMGAMEMSAPFWPLHLRALGQLSPQALAWASMTAYAGPMLMALCFTPLWGRLGDRIGHKPMVLRALAALALTQLVVALADSVALVLTARLAQGALGGFIAAAQAYGAGLAGRERRASLMAHLQVATAAGSALGPWLGGLMFDEWGFRAVNAWAALACALCAAAAACLLPAQGQASAPSTPKPPAGATDKTPAAFRPVLQGLLLGIVLVQTAKMMPQVFFGLFAQQVLHASASLSGLCWGATALGLCGAAPLWGRRFQQMAQAQVLRHVEWICWACAVIVAMQAVSRDPVVFVAARLLWGICLGALLPVFYALLSEAADDHEQGRVLGAGNGAAKAGALLGTAGGALILGWLPIEYAFWPLVAVYAVAGAGLRLMAATTRAGTTSSFITEEREKCNNQ